MLTVGEDAAEVERRLVAGGLVCPDCGDVLVGWGHARRRVIRGESGRVWVRPRRARCCGCHVTHVLLPVAVLLRRGGRGGGGGGARGGGGGRGGGGAGRGGGGPGRWGRGGGVGRCRV